MARTKVDVRQDNVVYVWKHGNDGNSGKSEWLAKLTIQWAINSITDATANKRYCVKIEAWDYNENVVGKDYVFLIWCDTNATRIKGTSWTLLTFPANSFRIQNIWLDLTTAANWSKCIDATAWGTYVIQNFECTIQSAVNVAVCQFMDIDCTLFIAAEFSCTANMTWSAAWASLKNYINIVWTTTSSIARFAIEINDADVDDIVVWIFDSSTWRTDIISESIKVNMTNGTYTWIAAWYAPFGTGSAITWAQITNLEVSSSWWGTWYGVYFDSLATWISELRNCSITTTGFTNNYSYYVAAWDTLYAIDNIINAALDWNVLGTIKRFDYDVRLLKSHIMTDEDEIQIRKQNIDFLKQDILAFEELNAKLWKQH